MLLLDTDALSHLLRGTPRGGLVEKIAAVPAAERFLSAITVGELYYGLEWMGERGDRLRERLEREFLARVEILPYDTDAARVYGRLRARLEHERQPLAEANLQIASIALSRGLSMLTGNGKHFRRIAELEPVEF